MTFSLRFTPFLREDSTMGLLTAKEAAEYLHVSLFTLGRIEKDSLLVPFRTPGGHRRYSQQMLNEYLERTRPHPEQGERRILIVDDGDELGHLLARTFPTWNFATAQDELQVGMRLAEFQPNLVLVNTRMKGIDGENLCRRLNAPGQNIKVLPFDVPVPAQDDSPASSVDLQDPDTRHASIATVLRPHLSLKPSES
jgi:CheY-like chemotaxis protein